MLRYIIIIFFFAIPIKNEILLSQNTRSKFAFGRYLCVKTFIVQAKVKRVGNFDFYAEVERWVKPADLINRKIKVRYNFSIQNVSQYKEAIALTPSKSYMFLITLKSKGHDKMVLLENSRFKVLGDSLCIGNYFLQGLDYNQDELNAENPLRDPLMPFGYMISVENFITLVEEVNKAFVKDEKINIHRYIGTSSTDPFTLAIIEEFNKSLCSGAPINREN